MSDVVDFPRGKGRGGPPAKPPAVPQPPVVALIRKRFLEPDRRRRELWNGAFEIAGKGDVLKVLLEVRRKPTEMDVIRARDLVARIPSDDYLDESYFMFVEAITVPAEPLEVGMIAAWIVDSFPNRSDAAGKTFVDSLELVLEDSDEGFSAITLAAVARHIIETQKFLPAISEVLSEAKRLQRKFAQAEEMIKHLQKMRERAERVLYRVGEISGEHDGEMSGEHDGETDVSEVPF